jgi:hypothetical protein
MLIIQHCLSDKTDYSTFLESKYFLFLLRTLVVHLFDNLFPLLSSHLHVCSANIFLAECYEKYKIGVGGRNASSGKFYHVVKIINIVILLAFVAEGLHAPLFMVYNLLIAQSQIQLRVKRFKITNS